ncbi:bifunctional 4-hydroxy-2-oxoglutarate aldolase/2-dehydro-3-deoxy-phosphogluconate aldolase [Moellerella wisconsensis]|uniref:2-dehydro-3-deoxy-phosphogluconate aldolase n=1 Tax=Moellerella wisconsensis TaxID=158849 RepID=A0A9Q8Q0V4_9GAMM|nr:bifunctional 4-hydroxy-2-oxoglutarate aldolase/2-dehydro-3-deoxy-phosphogluconate aldolase [Moellerella wisconsensis]UNH29962.1 bifunctional 4-hydroxy-2-oxoglutarate aldolase/2-dehydro-3-deoxy-phosphogluconate aldolase [Moellerella wisconsensis]
MHTALYEKLKQIKVIPVITINHAEHAVALAQVLIENGLPCAEVTFRTPAAAQAIKNMRAAYPDLLICAGTVLTPAQVDQAMAAGADFVVSPGFNPNVVAYCQQKNILIIPGINSPSLVEQAMEFDLKVFKFFPAEASGGLPMLKALSAVYPVEFMPTGGIDLQNIKAYFALKSVIACGGSWMVPTALIEAQQWDALAKLVTEAAAAV